MALGALLYWRMYRISFRRRSATEGEDAACDDVTLDLGEPQLRLVDDDVGQKGDELCRGVPRRGFAQHLAGFSVERGVQRQCAMAIILKAVPLRPPGRQRQHRVLAVERLDRRLLV